MLCAMFLSHHITFYAILVGFRKPEIFRQVSCLRWHFKTDAVTRSKENDFLLSGMYICMQTHVEHMLSIVCHNSSSY